MELTLTEFSRQEALRYMGCPPGGADSGLLSLVDICGRRILAAARPRWLFRIFSLLPGENGVILDCGLSLPGGDISAHLAGCDRAVLFCATLSSGVDLLLRQVSAGGDPAEALALEACASAAVESLCDQAEAVIRAGFPGCVFPPRFSPGYGDLPVKLQGALLDLLDAPRQIGLCATTNSILTPRKSVTAILGVGRGTLVSRPGGCAACSLRGRCQFQCKENDHD